MKKFAWLIIMLIIPCQLLAGADYYQFNSPDQQHQFQTLTTELRCLVCQNQNLAESNAGLAADLRGQIYQQIQHGKTNKEIVDYLSARYGDFILYNPPLNSHTLGLWFGPFVF